MQVLHEMKHQGGIPKIKSNEYNFPFSLQFPRYGGGT